jgi:hypothetical protein
MRIIHGPKATVTVILCVVILLLVGIYLIVPLLSGKIPGWTGIEIINPADGTSEPWQVYPEMGGFSPFSGEPEKNGNLRFDLAPGAYYIHTSHCASQEVVDVVAGYHTEIHGSTIGGCISNTLNYVN